jgi:hypothetical protein
MQSRMIGTMPRRMVGLEYHRTLLTERHFRGHEASQAAGNPARLVAGGAAQQSSKSCCLPTMQRERDQAAICGALVGRMPVAGTTCVTGVAYGVS